MGKIKSIGPRRNNAVISLDTTLTKAVAWYYLCTLPVNQLKEWINILPAFILRPMHDEYQAKRSFAVRIDIAKIIRGPVVYQIDLW